MTHPRGSTTVLAGLLASVLALVIVLQPATLAQSAGQGEGTTVTVGASTITYSDAWSADPAATSEQGIRLDHEQLPGTQFAYLDFDAPELDADDVLAATAERFFARFGDGTQELVTAGGATTIIDDTETRIAWRLYSATNNGDPFGVVLVTDSAALPGHAKVSVLAAPVESFAAAVQSVLDTIVLDGADSPFVGLDADDLAEDLGAPGAPATIETPATVAATEAMPEATATGTSGDLTLPALEATEPAGPDATPTETPRALTLPPLSPTAPSGADATATPGGLTLPPLNPTQPAGGDATATPGGLTLPPLNPTEPGAGEATETQGGLTLPPLGETATAPVAGGGSTSIGGLDVQYSDDWALDEENSTPDQSLFLDVTTGAFQFYGLFVAERSGLPASSSLMVLQDSYLEQIGGPEVENLLIEEPADGIAWSLFETDLAGFPVQMLLYVDTVSTPGQERYELLVSDPAGMADLLTQAQQTIGLDGVPAFAEVDPALVAAQAGTVPPMTDTLAMDGRLRAFPAIGQ